MHYLLLEESIKVYIKIHFYVNIMRSVAAYHGMACVRIHTLYHYLERLSCMFPDDGQEPKHVSAELKWILM
jgi:hypothetical protein